MSEENVELSLRLIDAWNRRDVEAWIALWHPEGVWSPPLEEITEGRTFRGHAGARQYFEDLAEVSEESDSEFPEVHDLGDEVLALGRVWLRFASGVNLDQEAAVPTAVPTRARNRMSKPIPGPGARSSTPSSTVADPSDW